MLSPVNFRNHYFQNNVKSSEKPCQLHFDNKTDCVSFSGSTLSAIEKITMGNTFKVLLNEVLESITIARKTHALEAAIDLLNDLQNACLTKPERTRCLVEVKKLEKFFPEGIKVDRHGEFSFADKPEANMFLNMWEQLPENILPIERNGDIDEYSLKILALNPRGSHMLFDLKPRGWQEFLDFKMFLDKNFIDLQDTLRAFEIEPQYKDVLIGKDTFSNLKNKIYNLFEPDNYVTFNEIVEGSKKLGIKVNGNLDRINCEYRKIIELEQKYLSLKKEISEKSLNNEDLMTSLQNKLPRPKSRIFNQQSKEVSIVNAPLQTTEKETLNHSSSRNIPTVNPFVVTGTFSGT